MAHLLIGACRPAGPDLDHKAHDFSIFMQWSANASIFYVGQFLQIDESRISPKGPNNRNAI
jgi:hypothetical protein